MEKEPCRPPGHWGGRFLLSAAGLSVACLVFEMACRIFRLNEDGERQLNNPYYFIERIGDDKFPMPYQSCAERVPLRYDHHDYYARTDGLIRFHTNQFGARWIQPRFQPPRKVNVLVLGDSFTYGHGLRYEDAFIFRLQGRMEESSQSVCFFNFARRGADAREVLAIYKRFKETVPHDAVLYGLHINDLLNFTTIYIEANPLSIPWIVERSKGYDFIARRIHKTLLRRNRIRRITDPALLKGSYFESELKALVTLNGLVRESGIRLEVVMLPLMVDMNKGTFRPLYDGIRKTLADCAIPCIDLTECLNGYSDRDVWILPFDQHPDHKANQVFADSLFSKYRRGEFLRRSL